MSILRGEQLGLAFGTHVLLDNVSFAVEPGVKTAIVGRNGAGKSSLLKVIAGKMQADSGQLQCSKGVRIRYLAQSLPEVGEQTVFDYVAEGVADLRDAVERYQYLLSEQGSEHEINQLHDFLDRTGAWHWEQKVESVLSRLDLSGDSKVSALSGGWRRRVALAECLAAEPDLLLLDEPTNHLDLTTIEWLEEVLKQYRGALLLISHDRQFIDAVVDKIWEVDRGNIHSFPAPYDDYVAAKELQLAEEEKVNAEFDKRLANEEKWIRQGIKARRTRNEGRVRALKKLRQERQQRRERHDTAQLAIKSGGASGKRVAVLDSVTIAQADKVLIEDFNAQVLKGDKIGILGPNGCGKSSLIKTLLGELAPIKGTVELGTQLDIAYFDQMRSHIKPDLSIMDNLGEGRDFIEVNGEKKHVISYLSDYGFGPERMRTPASSLSGGEVSRLVLAKLFTRSANLLILDEPTNDLDIETLELLESQLVEFKGTVIVISHDRRFLDNVAEALWVFTGEHRIVEIAGGFTDYQRYRLAQEQRAVKSKSVEQESANASKNKKLEESPKKTAAVKLSYKFQRELDALPALLERLETDISDLEIQAASAEFQSKAPTEMQAHFEQLAVLQQQLEQQLDRWEELEAMKSGN
ncbi:ATP-binding cassette domain-containing protein [Pleionea litopenaei]|uniref:ATP-binding protein Uup n=1 Tax=Pleionea litopenaei TaxID=3070815 RepID=A0AA51RVP2_9GAMM|nr:ATP-binding cassette domain-containing protein [Pleionea sp. HL-JVS1]WMS88319.1 ATP-binding cassette domain-containing protein [Pleionea sp. HL-JVS1]